MSRFPALLIVLALAVTACGGTTRAGGPTGPGQEPLARAATSAEPNEQEPKAEASQPGSSPVAADRPAPGSNDDEEERPFGDPTPGPAPHNTMPLEVTLSKTCARPGDQMQATAETLPRSKLAFTAHYEEDDDGYVPDFQYVEDEMNPTGTYTWTWVIKPSVDPGEALVTVVAAKDDKGASYNAPFRVSRSC